MSQQRKLEDRVTSLSFNENANWRKVQQEILDHLGHNDYYVSSASERGGDLACVYSVGLWHSFKHPEIITFGLPEEQGRCLLLDLRNLIKLGHFPMVSRALGRCVGHYPIQLEPIRDRQIIREYLPMANWFYGEESFPVFQLFWSDLDGRFSWDQYLEPGYPMPQTV